MPPFVVYSLPRSRTFWLSRYLTHGGWACGHEEIRRARSLDDVKAWLGMPLTGTVETTAAPWWRLARQYRPDLTTVVVRRPVPDVVRSLVACGFKADAVAPFMRQLDRKLDQIEARVPNVLSVRFEDLATEATCAAIYERCLGLPHDPAWWRDMTALNIQIDMPALERYMVAYLGQLEKLAKVAKHQIIAGMARRPVAEPDGLTIQQETFETFFRDGQSLFAEHLIDVGEAPDGFWTKNLRLMRVLEDIGAMQITTARSNGRMFGYVMAVVSPSLESPNETCAMHLVFYASREFPGLGLKLQRASEAALRARGVDELFLRAGPRGSGPKLGTLYRRMGAEDFGRMFRLKLKDAV